MFSAKNYLNWIFSAVLVVVMGCNGGGFGCGCAGMEPVPDLNNDGVPDWNYIPVDQQVEGGGQLRVSPNGFNTLTSVLLDPTPITADNLDVVLDAGWIDEETLCAGVASGTVDACP